MDKLFLIMYNGIMDIKLIGLDLDGTLLHEDKTLDKSTIEYLEHLAEKGIEIVPITGRPLYGVPQLVRGIKGVNYIITSNGAQITENATSLPLFQYPLSTEQSQEIIDIVSGFDCLYEVFYEGYGHCEPKVFDHFKRVYTCTPIGEYIFSSRKVVDDIKAQFKGTKLQADEIFIICKDQHHREEIKAQTDKIKGIQYCMLADRFLEITKLGTDKGFALETLCNHLNIDLKNTIAFGDGENDLEFLSKAGISVAMGNAKDIVKQKAHIIADTNDNNGVEKTLREIFAK